MSEPTCWTLIRSAATGDESARAEFSRLYRPAVQAYLQARWSNRLSAEDREDAAQEVFVECLREDGVLDRAAEDRGEGFRAFLYGVVRNVALRFESRGARRLDPPRSGTFHADAVPADEESLTRAFDRAWALSMLAEARERLVARADGSDERAVRRAELLRLRFHEGLSVLEIARRWNVDSSALYRDYRRGLEEFHEALKEVVSFHQPLNPESVQSECRALLALV